MANKEAGNNSYGLVSFILGLFSLIFFVFVLPPVIMSITSIVFGVLQLRKHKSKLAIAGIILSIVALGLSIFMLVSIVKTGLLISAFVQCQQDPNSPACTMLVEKISAQHPQYSSEFIKQCILDPSAPGCDAFTKESGGYDAAQYSQ